MVDQLVPFRLTRVQRLFQCIEHEVSSHRDADSTANDAPGEDVDDEGHVDETLPGRDVREIADQQLVGRWALNWRRLSHRRAHDLTSHDATQAGFAHQALHGKAGHVSSLTSKLVPHLVGP